MQWYKISTSKERIENTFGKDEGYLKAKERAKKLPPNEREEYLRQYEDFLIDDRYKERGE